MTGRKRWIAAVAAETKKEMPALPYARQVRAAKRADASAQAGKKAA